MFLIAYPFESAAVRRLEAHLTVAALARRDESD